MPLSVIFQDSSRIDSIKHKKKGSKYTNIQHIEKDAPRGTEAWRSENALAQKPPHTLLKKGTIATIRGRLAKDESKDSWDK